MNWVFNNITTVYIRYTSIISYLYFAELSFIILHGSKVIVSEFSQIEHQLMDRKKFYHSYVCLI